MSSGVLCPKERRQRRKRDRARVGSGVCLFGPPLSRDLEKAGSQVILWDDALQGLREDCAWPRKELQEAGALGASELDPSGRVEQRTKRSEDTVWSLPHPLPSPGQPSVWAPSPPAASGEQPWVPMGPSDSLQLPSSPLNLSPLLAFLTPCPALVSPPTAPSTRLSQRLIITNSTPKFSLSSSPCSPPPWHGAS